VRSMYYLTARATTSLSSGVRRLVVLVALAAVALVSPVGSATANAPFKVCATCTYTDIPSALVAAAAQSGDDTIQVAPGSYPEAITISTNVTLLGAGAGQTTIGRVDVGAGVSVTINGVTIHGVGFGGPGESGITNAGTLTLKSSVVSGNQTIASAGILNLSTGTATVQDSTVTRNSAFFASGGGIFNAGTMTLQHSTVSHNGTAAAGGGIYNQGALTLQASTVSDNGAYGPGGGIANAGTMTLQDSTVSDNLVCCSSLGGGGIYNGTTGTMTLRNSTVSGNSASLFALVGGGISNHGTLTLRDSTVSGNNAIDRGGGIYNSSTGTGTLTNSTVIGNTAPVGPGIFNDGGTMTIKDSTVQP
jgi:hypothetical protein